MNKILSFAIALGLALSCGPGPQEPEQPAAVKPEPVKILQFYATPGVVSAGDEVTFCYGVEGDAQELVMEPRVRDLRPTFNRCFNFAPKESAIYTLTARGRGGEASEQLAIQVVPAAAEPAKEHVLTLFMTSSQQVDAGQPVTLCYAVEAATEVSITPPVTELEPVSRCFTVTMEKTTTFNLTAVGASGKRESREITVRVN